MKHSLKVYLGRPGAPAPSGPAIFPGQALYARPNPDGTRKMCRNCVLWLSMGECAIHDADVVATPNTICGYHVYGRPDAGLTRESLDPVPPELSGLEQVRGGTSCDTCTYYKPQGATGGTCGLVRDPQDPDLDFPVEALGCCNFWNPVDGV